MAEREEVPYKWTANEEVLYEWTTDETEWRVIIDHQNSKLEIEYKTDIKSPWLDWIPYYSEDLDSPMSVLILKLIGKHKKGS